MPEFIYTATNQDGKTIHGLTEAVNRDAVISTLEHQNLRPVVIKLDTAKHLGRFNKAKKVKGKDMVVFTRQLSTMISAGVPLAQSLSTLQNQSTNKYFQSVVANVAKDVESGQPLADGFAKFPNVFSEVYVNMVRAGEAGGILDDILKRLAIQVEQSASMKKKIKGAMMYPAVILSITVIAFFGITVFIMPKIAKILKDLGGPHAQLPIYTRILLTISADIRSNILFIIIGLFGGVWLIRRYVKSPKGKYRFHQLLLKMPVISNIITKVAIARFARTFASLTGAGVGVLNALEVTGGAIGNKVIEEELKEAAVNVKNGRQLSESLAHSQHFPAIIPQMLAVGEETGQIDMVLVKVADFYEEEVETIIDSLSSILEPILIVVLGAGVGLIAASVMGPIASLSKNIGNN